MNREALRDAFVQRGYPATLEYPGYVAVQLAAPYVGNVGNANGSWAMDVYASAQAELDGAQPIDVLDTEIGPNSTDPIFVATCLIDGLPDAQVRR
jgi:hypothetical protein